MNDIIAALDFFGLGDYVPQIQNEKEKAWKEARKGKFTASRIADLCAKDRSGKGFGKVAISYMNEIVGERLGEIKEDIETEAMRYGKEYERIAFKVLANGKGDALEYLSQVFIPLKGFEDFAGASPDFSVQNHTIGEIKVPFTTAKYLEYLELKNENDLLSYSKAYYYQIQMQMLTTGVNCGLFVAFNPKWVENENLVKRCLKFIEITPNPLVQDDIMDCIARGKAYVENKISGLQ